MHRCIYIHWHFLSKLQWLVADANICLWTMDENKSTNPWILLTCRWESVHQRKPKLLLTAIPLQCNLTVSMSQGGSDSIHLLQQCWEIWGTIETNWFIAAWGATGNNLLHRKGGIHTFLVLNWALIRGGVSICFSLSLSPSVVLHTASQTLHQQQ